MNLTATQIAKLTAIVKGEDGYKRAATKSAAEGRFRTALGEKIGKLTAVVEGDTILGAASFEEAAETLRTAIETAAAFERRDQKLMAARAEVSPGLARLRRSPKAEEIREGVLADSEAALEGLKGKRKTRAAIDVAAEAAPQPEPKKKRERKARAEKPKAEGTANRTRVSGEEVITAVCENPKKPGSRAHACFAVYRAGQTAGQFIAACEAAGIPAKEAKSNLSWDRRKGFITVGEGA